MTFIDLEFDRGYFLDLLRAGLALGPSVPFPTLAPLGQSPGTVDRLISRWDWVDQPVWDPQGVPSYQPAAGVGLIRVAVDLDHVGVTELRLDPHAPGVGVTGRVWMSLTITPGQLSVETVAFAADGSTPVVLPVPLPTLRFELPTLPVPVPVAGVVVDDTVVALRFGTSAGDALGQPPAHFLDRRAADSSANWTLHVPAQVFQDLVVGPLGAALAGEADVAVEEAPSSSWRNFGGDSWGVDARAGVVKQDACPGIGGDVDISIDLTASLAMTVVAVTTPVAGTALDLVVTQSADASDWDSFRCWLGSGGVLGAVVGLVNPVLGVGVAIGTLIGISEVVRGDVGDAFADSGAPAVPGAPLTLASHDTGSATYTGRLGLPPIDLPVTLFQQWELNASGLDCYGQSLVVVPTRRTSWLPDGGTLSSGDWTRRINCSHRTVDQAFTYQPIIVADQRLVGERTVAWLPVQRYLTSVAEPMGQAAFEHQDLGVFRLHATGSGQVGWALLHTSAGLRVFHLDPAPPTPAAGPDSRHLINVFCDAQREIDLVIDRQLLGWPEPPPDYDYGFDPLRQWQIVLQALPPDARVVVLDARDGRTLLTRDDFDVRGRNAATALVTAADTELAVQVEGAERVRLVAARRWLVPVERGTSDVVTGRPRPTSAGLVAVRHDGELVVAVPGQTTS